jgi:hypothetical protein
MKYVANKIEKLKEIDDHFYFFIERYITLTKVVAISTSHSVVSRKARL